MNRAYLNKTPYFLLVSIIFFFAIEAAIYEDGIYFYFAKSFINDWDINIINQVDESFRGFLTKTLYFPTHHSLIQTPVLVPLYLLESFFRDTLGLEVFREGVLSGFLLHSLSLFLGLKFSKDYVKELGVPTSSLATFLIFFTTSVLYYSFLALMVIEVFAFPLASYSLLSVARMKNGKSISYFGLGLCLGLLISSKVYYLGLTAYIVVELVLAIRNVGPKRFLQFLCSLLLPLIPSVWIHYQQYGEFFFWAGELSESMSSFTLINVRETLIHGLWDKRGIFFVNPIYIFVFITVVLHGIKLILKKESFIEGGFYLAWLFQGFFTTLFIAGALISDQYIGRLVMSILPLLYLGISLFLEKLKGVNKLVLWGASIGLFLLQLYQCFNYMIAIKEDHYLYANKRFLPWEDLTDGLGKVLAYSLGAIGKAPLIFLTIVTIVTLIFLFLEKHRDKLERGFSFFLVYVCSFLGLISLMNFYNADKNIKSYFEKNDVKKVTIGKTPRVYSFIYVTDGLKSQYLGTSDPELRKENRKKLREYYEKIQDDFEQVTPEFKAMMKENLKGIESTKYYLGR